MSGGQLEVEVLEDRLKAGDDLDHDERQDAHGDRDDDDRVDHRAFDFALERFGPFLEVGEALENDFEGAARLAGLDHVDVEAVEALGLLAMASESVSPPSIASQVSSSEYLSRPGLDCSARMRSERRIGRPASWRMESWRVNAVSCLDLTPPKTKPRFFLPPAGFGLLPALLDGDLRDEVPHLPDRGLRIFLGGGLDHVLDLGARRVHRLELKSGHGVSSCVTAPPSCSCNAAVSKFELRVASAAEDGQSSSSLPDSLLELDSLLPTLP